MESILSEVIVGRAESFVPFSRFLLLTCLSMSVLTGGEIAALFSISYYLDSDRVPSPITFELLLDFEAPYLALRVYADAILSKSLSLFALSSLPLQQKFSVTRFKMLQPSPMQAVISMISPLTSIKSGLRSLLIASNNSQMSRIQIMRILARAPNTSALWYPNEYFKVEFFLVK